MEGIHLSNLAIAQKMLQAGESVDKIVQWTGLAPEEIEKNRKNT